MLLSKFFFEINVAKTTTTFSLHCQKPEEFFSILYPKKLGEKVRNESETFFCFWFVISTYFFFGSDVTVALNVECRFKLVWVLGSPTALQECTRWTPVPPLLECWKKTNVKTSWNLRKNLAYKYYDVTKTCCLLYFLSIFVRTCLLCCTISLFLMACYTIKVY